MYGIGNGIDVDGESRFRGALVLDETAAAEPDPAPGQLKVIARSTGLWIRNAAGTESLLATTADIGGGTTRATLASDAQLQAISPNWVTIPGLQVSLDPGVHRVRVHGRFTSQAGDAALSHASLASSGGSARWLKVDYSAISASEQIVSNWVNMPWQETTTWIAGPGIRTILLDNWVYVESATTLSLVSFIEPPNGSTGFEDLEPGNWFGVGSSVGATTEFARTGAASAGITAFGGENSYAVCDLDAEPGESWTLSAWLYSPTEKTDVGVLLTFTDDQDNIVGTQESFATLPADTWTQRSVQLAAPAGTTAVHANIGMKLVGASPAVDDTVFMDDVIFAHDRDDFTALAGTYIQTTPW